MADHRGADSVTAFTAPNKPRRHSLNISVKMPLQTATAYQSLGSIGSCTFTKDGYLIILTDMETSNA